MPLTEYRRKRRSGRTPEPKGRAGRSRGPLRFVVQRHDAAHRHFDLRLELDGVLLSWAVPKGPAMEPAIRRLAIQVEDHPLDYLAFEGDIPPGHYGAGSVRIWDRGTYAAAGAAGSAESRRRLREGLAKGHLVLDLAGEKLRGEYHLLRARTGKPNTWLLFKPAGRDGPPSPMLATLVDAPFDREGWLFETKWDGNRVLAQVDRGKVRLWSRNRKDWTRLYPPVAEALGKLDRKAVLDGEVVVLDRAGRSDFGALQRWPETGEGELAYMVFDCLELDGRDLRPLPLAERRQALRPLVAGLARVRFSEAIERDGIACYDEARKRGLEGIIAKDGASPYQPGRRSRAWLKVKTGARQEVVIGGFTEGRGARRHLGALLVGVYEGPDLRYAGRVGSGFDARTLAHLAQVLGKRPRSASPFADASRIRGTVHWVAPDLVCEVAFREWTRHGRLRQPLFLGLRADKDPRDVKRESPAAAPILPGSFRIARPGKVFWPAEGFTKGDLARYYETVADFLLPILRDRPEAMHRFPDGIGRPGFHQQNLQRHPDWIRTVRLRPGTVDREIAFLLCDSLDALLYMVDLGCVDLNPWHSRVASLDRPDYLLLDLDAKTAGFPAVLEVAREARRMLEDLRLASVPKTSGKTGIHICLPLGARYSYDQARALAEGLMRALNRRLPDLTSVERLPERRPGRVYLDFLQNHRGKTMAAPYSVRPVAGAPVSTPLDWSEVTRGLTPSAFTLVTGPARFRRVGDLWAPVLGPAVDLPGALAVLRDSEASPAPFPVTASGSSPRIPSSRRPS